MQIEPIFSLENLVGGTLETSDLNLRSTGVMENRRSVFFLGELILEPLWDFEHRSTQVPKSVLELAQYSNNKLK